MSITRVQVEKVAALANLELTDDELATFTEQLAGLLHHFEQLDALDTEGVEPTSHAVPLSCPTRADEAQPSALAEALLERAPAPRDGHFAVPKVID